MNGCLRRSCLVSRAVIQTLLKPKTIRMSSEKKESTLPTGIVKDFEEKYFESAAAGHIDDVKTYLKGAVKIDAKNDRGWTALMYAARNGQDNIVSYLLQQGCDVNTLNSTGQTAVDIAQYWNHNEVLRRLKSEGKDQNSVEDLRNYFSLNKLNRCSDKRKDVTWMKNKILDESTRFVLFSNLNALVLPLKDKNSKWKYELARFELKHVEQHLAKNPLVIFLGLQQENRHMPLTFEEPGFFAVDVSTMDEAKLLSYQPEASFVGAYPGSMQLEPSEAGIFAEARSMLVWHDRYSFCATCGSETLPEEGGYKRICKNLECRSHKGIHNTCYPRTDPSTIMVVISPDGKKCLLGRSSRFPPKMWSCLAGFMEPGESIEDTVRREVEEEVGVIVDKVEYHSSQPWPYPASLMLGCVAYATTTHIKLDENEMEDARWFTRPEVVQMLTRQHPEGMFVPPEQAIAHQLIKTWVRRTANL